MKRNKDGLVDGFNYSFDANGRINWKSHIGQQWLRVKDDKIKEVEARYGKKIKDINLSEIEDYYLYVKLGGYNEVARLRGFDSLTHSVDYVDGQKAVVTCTMHFIPNVEDTNGLTCAGVASGSIYNIKPEFASFMETFAENRAFARCVRRALNINIVAEEELGKGLTLVTSDESVPSLPEGDSTKAYGYLAKLCTEKGITFDQLKTRSAGIKSMLKSNPGDWSEWKDIPKIDIWTLVEKVKSA